MTSKWYLWFSLVLIVAYYGNQLYAQQFEFRDDDNTSLGTIEDDGSVNFTSSMTVTNTAVFGSSVTAEYFIGDGSNLTGLKQSGIITVAASTSTSAIFDVNTTTFVAISTLAVTLDGDRRILGTASVTINNNGNITSEYSIRVRRGTMTVSPVFIHEIPKAVTNTVAITYEESSSPSGATQYILQIKSDNVVGGSNFQRVEAQGMTLLEF